MHFNSKYIEDIVGFACEHGMTKAMFENRLGKVNPSCNVVDYNTVVDYLKLAVDGTGDQCFGLHLGEYNVLQATKAVDNIMERSLSVQDAFHNAVEYSKLISDAMDCSLLTNKDQSFSVTFKNNPNWHMKSALAKRHNLDTALVSAVKALVFLTGQHYYPLHLKLPYSRVKTLNEYYRVFNCSITFNCDFAEIVFDRNLLDKKLEKYDVGLLQKLIASARQQLKALGKEDKLITQVKRKILENIVDTHYPNLVEVAHLMHMTPRTLQRKLKEKASGFVAILNDVKLNLALRHMEDDNLQIDEVAYLSGYSESSAFIRAFKRWKGISPGAYLVTKIRGAEQE